MGGGRRRRGLWAVALAWLMLAGLQALGLATGVAAAGAATVRPGLEVLLQERTDLLVGRRVGLITNRAGVDSQGRSGIDLLARDRRWQLVALFSPEHGLRATAGAGEAVESGRDPVTGLPVYSLYGAQLSPPPEVLRQLDVLLFDLQDAGARFYTYISTMAYAMQAAAKAGIRFVVLDRPNPIGGLATEGPVLEERWRSFVGVYPIPIRHGMTVGELALLFNDAFGIGADLVVVPTKGWRRHLWFDQTGLPWVAPSPNMRTLATATVYPGMALVEGTNLSEGRGTPWPFEVAGAPWVDGPRWAQALNSLGLPGVRFEPVSFTPTESKYRGQSCQGIRVVVTDRESFAPVRTGVAVVATAARLFPAQFRWLPPSGGAYPFDRLAGTDRVRVALAEGASPTAVADSWEPALEAFRRLRSRYLLYPE